MYCYTRRQHVKEFDVTGDMYVTYRAFQNHYATSIFTLYRTFTVGTVVWLVQAVLVDSVLVDGHRVVLSVQFLYYENI